MIEKYIKQDLNLPKYLFHGSPELLDNIEIRKSHDSSGASHNIDTAVFLTSSFLLATAYAFKDKIKQVSIDKGLDYNFKIDSYGKFPIMSMNNVSIPENLEGYVYVFQYDEKIKNDPIESLQYKSYTNLKPIDTVKVNYEDFKSLYEVIQKTR